MVLIWYLFAQQILANLPKQKYKINYPYLPKTSPCFVLIQSTFAMAFVKISKNCFVGKYYKFLQVQNSCKIILQLEQLMNCTLCLQLIDQYTLVHHNHYHHQYPYYCCSTYTPNPSRTYSYAICNKCASPGNFRAFVKSLYNFAEMCQVNQKMTQNQAKLGELQSLAAQRDAADQKAKNYEQLKMQLQSRNQILSYFVSDEIVQTMKTFTTYIDDLRKEKLSFQAIVDRSLRELINEMNQRTSDLIETQTQKITLYLKCEQQNKNASIMSAKKLCQQLKQAYSTAKLPTTHDEQEIKIIRESDRDAIDRERIYSDEFVSRIVDIFAEEIVELSVNEGQISKLRREGELLSDKLRASPLRRNKLEESAIDMIEA